MIQICIACSEEMFCPGCQNLYKWTSVKTKLPLYKQCVLVYLTNNTITEAVYRGEYDKGQHVFRFELTRDDSSDMVTHWMDLPREPKQ